MSTFYHAEVLADSIANGVRLTTLLAVFPRFILAEMNTHRVFSRNSASSRAIPTEVNIERVLNDPFVPATFNKRVKGMGVGEELVDRDAEDARRVWLGAAQGAARHANHLNGIGIDKSRANRILEPFMWHTAIITSTEWANFYGLRAPDGEVIDLDFPAQPEMQQIAILMRKAMRESEPAHIEYGDWHRPLVDDKDIDTIVRQWRLENDETYTEVANKLSARRLARVSFDKHLESEPVVVSIDKSGQLIEGAHWSPLEHVATPIDNTHIQDPRLRLKLMVPVDYVWKILAGESVDPLDGAVPTSQVWAGNLRGWFQFRKMFPNEHMSHETGEWPS